MIIKLRSFMANLQDEGHKVPTVTELAKDVGVSRVQMQRIVGGHVESVKLNVVANIIAAMRRRGYSMDVSDVFEYRD